HRNAVTLWSGVVFWGNRGSGFKLISAPESFVGNHPPGASSPGDCSAGRFVPSC
ncbi:unnamed protein product, partial [Ixodes pacificus]